MSAPRTVLFSAMKNEAPFILEWVAYHKAIGFDEIIVVSNDSDDGSTALLDALDAAGEVRHLWHSVPEGASPQAMAAEAGNASGLIADGDWVVWLDADEFLNIHSGEGRVGDLIGALGPARALLISWRIFGDSGHAEFPGRFISEAFTGAGAGDFAGNRIIKTFYRHGTDETRLSPVANHRPALLKPGRFRGAGSLAGTGLPLDTAFRPHKRWLMGVEGKANFNILPEEHAWRFAQINHYMLRTREMFDLKAYRGRGFVNMIGGQAVKRPRHTPAFFEANNRNEAEDRSILRQEGATGAGLARLLAIPAVREAHEAGIALTRERIARMREEAAQPGETLASELLAGEVPAPPELSQGAAPPGAAAPDGPRVPGITMPAAERALLEQHYAAHDVILEYGSGSSTLLAAGQNHSLVMSVESDAAWADNLRQVLARDFPAAPVRIWHADIGKTGAWGRPVNHRSWKGYHRYPMAIWDEEWFRHPDLILIDGRFRVGCLLNALYRITRPVTVLFDDYANRPHYIAAVETFVRPAELRGRMARFELEPSVLPPARLTEIAGLLSLPD